MGAEAERLTLRFQAMQELLRGLCGGGGAGLAGQQFVDAAFAHADAPHCQSDAA